MYANKEDAGVKAILVFGSEKMDVAKVGWRKEGFQGNKWVQDDGISVEPAKYVGLEICHAKGKFIQFH